MSQEPSCHQLLQSTLDSWARQTPWTAREQNFDDIWEREEGKRLDWGCKVLISGGSQITIPVKARLLLPGGSPQPKTLLKEVLGWSKHAWWQMESPEAATSSISILHHSYNHLFSTPVRLLLQSSWINQTVLACHHIFPSTDLPFQPHASARGRKQPLMTLTIHRKARQDLYGNFAKLCCKDAQKFPNFSCFT